MVVIFYKEKVLPYCDIINWIIIFHYMFPVFSILDIHIIFWLNFNYVTLNFGYVSLLHMEMKYVKGIKFWRVIFNILCFSLDLLNYNIFRTYKFNNEVIYIYKENLKCV